jgi:sugar phosphate isomerase/epimerase
MNKRSIATVSLSGALDEKLRAIAAAGFDEVEIFEADLLSFNGSPRDVGQMCRDLGLTICAFQPFRDFEGMPEPQRTRNFARAMRKFDLMQDLQTDLMLVCSNISPDSAASIAPPQISGNLVTSPPGTACASDSRLWPGAPMLTIIGMPGRSSAAPIILRSA